MEKRMYFLVNRSLSSIQKSIQAGHAALEYCSKYRIDDDLWDFVNNHKTWIVLDGGTSNSSSNYRGDMDINAELLNTLDVKHSIFREPDLNDCLTAICLIVDERVFNKKDYPNFIDFLEIIHPDIQQHVILHMKMNIEEAKIIHAKEYKIWLDNIGGKQNEFLRDFLSQFKLAL